MPYQGHVENGAIVLDEPAHLEEGARVLVELVEAIALGPAQTPLRGTTYAYDDPFSPAVDEEDWDAAQ